MAAVIKHDGCALEGYAGGVGPVPCDLMFVGEALGATEAISGRPFDGRSGKRLDMLLDKYLGRKRATVYVTNLVKHRPPGNRRPKKAEVVACQSYLVEEVKLVNPRIIVPMGDKAVNWFLPKSKISKVHGRPVQLGDDSCAPGAWVVPWYHPAAGFRSSRVLRSIAEDAKDFWTRLTQAEQSYETEYQLVDDLGAVQYLWQHKAGGEIGFDVETTAWKVGKANRFGQVVGYSLSAKPLSAVYVADGPETMKPVLEDMYWTKYCHNAKFELKQLRKHGIEMRGYEDTMGLAYVLGYESMGLKSLASKLLSVPVRDFTTVVKGVDLVNPEALSKHLATEFEYGCSDADNTRRLWYILHAEAVREGVLKVYMDIEKPLIPILADMEEVGVGLDIPRLEALRDRIGRLKALAKVKAEAELGVDLTREKLAVRLKELGAPIRKLTPAKGLMKTDADTLARIREWNPRLIDGVLNYYRYEKLLAFPVGLLQMVDVDGRIRASINQFGRQQDDDTSAPATGRLSYSQPNLQQIPHTGDRFLAWWGRRLRACFLP